MFDIFWAISEDTLRILLSRLVETNGTVLECGSGRSTVEIARVLKGHRRHIALEQSPYFWGNTLEALASADASCELTLGALVDDFYPLPELKDGEVDLLFVDGPDHGGDRSKALPLLDRYLASEAVVIVDDADRDAEMIRVWLADGRWTATYPPTVRGCAVLTRTR